MWNEDGLIAGIWLSNYITLLHMSGLFMLEIVLRTQLLYHTWEVFPNSVTVTMSGPVPGDIFHFHTRKNEVLLPKFVKEIRQLAIQSFKGQLQNPTAGWTVVPSGSGGMSLFRTKQTSRNRTKPPVNQWLGFEVVPKIFFLNKSRKYCRDSMIT